MSLIQELEELIAKTGVYNDRELLERVLYELKKTRSNHWGIEEISYRIRK
jgi:hypothetical protein